MSRPILYTFLCHFRIIYCGDWILITCTFLFPLKNMATKSYISIGCLCICLLALSSSVSFIDGSHFTIQSGIIDITGYTVLRRQVELCSQSTETSVVNLQEQRRLMLDCMVKYITHCVDYFAKPVKVKVTFCGKLAVASRALQAHVYVNLLHRHVVLFKFVVFNLYRTFDDCGPDNVQLTDVAINQIHTFCGRRIPWSVITTGQEGHLAINVHDNRRSNLLVFYSAQHMSHIHSVKKEMQWQFLSKSPSETVYSHILFSHGIVYCTSPHLALRVDIQWKQQYKLMTVYDGPGRRSSSILQVTPSSYFGPYYALSSAYCVYILIEHTPINLDQATISIGTLLSGHVKCPYRTNQRKQLVFLKIHSLNTEYNYGCRKEIYVAPILDRRMFPLFHFLSVTIDGPDTITSSNQGCDYGGIFIQELRSNTSNFHKSFCRSTRRTVIYSETIKFKILVISFAGYHSVNTVARILFRTCPTTYVNNVFKNTFNTEQTCRHFVCKVSACKIILVRKKGPIGPIVLKLSGAQTLKADARLVDLKVPITCSSEIHMMYLAFQHWPLKRDIYLKRIKYKHTKTNHEALTENIQFLHNASVSLLSCFESPVGMSMYVSYCGKPSAYQHNHYIFSPSAICDVIIPILQSVTVYSFETVGVPLFIFVNYKNDCSLTCRGHRITLHEKTPNDGVIYEYSATLVDSFDWWTSSRQDGFLLRIIPPALCSEPCAVNVHLYKSHQSMTMTSNLQFIHHHNNR